MRRNEWLTAEELRHLEVQNPSVIKSAAQQKIELLRIVKAIYPDTFLLYRCSYYEAIKSYQIWGSELCFRTEGHQFTFRTTESRTFYLDIDHSHLQDIWFHSEMSLEAKKGLTEPETFRKPNAKKLEAWVKFRIAWLENLEYVNNKNKVFKNIFLKKIKTDPDLVWQETERKGYIIRNGVLFRFEIHPGRIEQHVTLRIGCGNYDDFQKISDNAYRE